MRYSNTFIIINHSWNTIKIHVEHKIHEIFKHVYYHHHSWNTIKIHVWTQKYMRYSNTFIIINHYWNTIKIHVEHKIHEIFKHVYYHQSLIKYNKNTRGTQIHEIFKHVIIINHSWNTIKIHVEHKIHEIFKHVYHH